jgi:hypothetical protein
MATEIRKNDDHSYQFGERTVPSVTEVLAAVGIIDYRWLRRESREHSLERGTTVHQAISWDIEGDLDEASAIEAGVMPYVEAARRARRELNLDLTLVEHVVFDPVFWYAGTIDACGDSVIVDWKTGRCPKWVGVQLAAYAQALGRDRRRPGSDFALIAIELHEDATYRVVPVKDYATNWGIFSCALAVHRAKALLR